MNEISAIVVTYNRKNVLLSCLAHLLGQEGVSFDIIIIDNASTDGTHEAVMPWLNNHVLYFNTGENIGGAGGFNFGMKKAFEAGYRFFWLMDDDTLPHPDALSRLIEADHILGGSYGFLSSATFWTDGTECKMNRQKISKSYYERMEVLKHGLIRIDQATFVSFLVRAETVQSYGLPIRDFFIWGDDIEYSRRIAIRGGSPGYLVGQSQVVHAMVENTGSNIATDRIERIERYRYAYRNECYLYRQEGFYGVCYFLAKCGRDFFRILFQANKQKVKRLGVLLSAMLQGMWFNPKVEKISKNGCKTALPVLVYYSNYDWQMIKQRQQFLCEALSRYYCVHAVFQHRYRRRILQRGEQTSRVWLHQIYLLPPFGWRFSVINAINNAIRKQRLRKIIQHLGADILVLSHPEQVDLIPADYSGRIVYDCMDNNIVAPPDGKERLRAEQECRLCAKADTIWSSSLYIQRMLQEKYAALQPPLLVRNACSSDVVSSRALSTPEPTGERFRICYFGMIAEWFDFSLLLYSLNRFPNIEYHLIGPISKTYCSAFQHPRIVYHGTVEHASLAACVRGMDCFVMPFILSDLIEAVDPVKIYEYIGFRRNVICLDYPEIERFYPFIHVYTSKEEYCLVLEQLLKDNRLKYLDIQAEEFLIENTWEKRADTIFSFMGDNARNEV